MWMRALKAAAGRFARADVAEWYVTSTVQCIHTCKTVAALVTRDALQTNFRRSATRRIFASTAHALGHAVCSGRD
jgi:hypothetical protein